MTSKTHIGFSVLTLSIVNIFIPFNFILVLSPCIIGSLLPDVDTEKSWAAQSIPFIDDVLRYFSKKTKNKFFGHRNKITHLFMPFVLFAVYLNVAMIYKELMLALIVGWTSHIVLDKISDIFRKIIKFRLFGDIKSLTAKQKENIRTKRDFVQNVFYYGSYVLAILVLFF